MCVAARAVLRSGLLDFFLASLDTTLIGVFRPAAYCAFYFSQARRMAIVAQLVAAVERNCDLRCGKSVSK